MRGTARVGASAVVIAVGLALPLQGGEAPAVRGEALYAEQKCKLCHSIGGEGNKKGPLDEVGGQFGAAELRAWLLTPDEMAKKSGKDRKPKMKKYDKLSEADLDALVAYMLSLKR